MYGEGSCEEYMLRFVRVSGAALSAWGVTAVLCVWSENGPHSGQREEAGPLDQTSFSAISCCPDSPAAGGGGGTEKAGAEAAKH